MKNIGRDDKAKTERTRKFVVGQTRRFEGDNGRDSREIERKGKIRSKEWKSEDAIRTTGAGIEVEEAREAARVIIAEEYWERLKMRGYWGRYLKAAASMREQKVQSAFLGTEQRGLNDKLGRNRKTNKREKIIRANTQM